MAKYKMTGFARFFIFLLIATPIVYLIASYYNGQDGLANMKSLFQGGEKNTSSETNEKDPDIKNETYEIPPSELEQANALIDSLKTELKACKANRN